MESGASSTTIVQPKFHQVKNELGKKLVVVLEGANLETVKVGVDYEILNSDDHGFILKKRKREADEARPDIVHQCLLMLLDSPLNKAGLLQVFVHTNQDVLIEIHPSTRIPRTFKRFSGLMVQLLHKLSIRATNGPDKLLKVIKNPVTDHLPLGVKKIGTDSGSSKLVDIDDYVKTNFKEEPVVFVLGAFAHGNVNDHEAQSYVDETISFSKYPLSGAVACSKLCSAFEKLWGIL